jgi:hypothetical protein
LTPESIQASEYQRAQQQLDYVFVMENPAASEAKALFNNELSVSVIDYVRMRIQSNPGAWRREQMLESPWGPITLYRNLARQPVV